MYLFEYVLSVMNSNLAFDSSDMSGRCWNLGASCLAFVCLDLAELGTRDLGVVTELPDDLEGVSELLCGLASVEVEEWRRLVA